MVVIDIFLFKKTYFISPIIDLKLYLGKSFILTGVAYEKRIDVIAHTSGSLLRKHFQGVHARMQHKLPIFNCLKITRIEPSEQIL
jgi:hypothetical protein